MSGLRDLLRRTEMELRDSAAAAAARNSPLTAQARIDLADEIRAALASCDTRRMAETGNTDSVRSTGGAVGEAETPKEAP